MEYIYDRKNLFEDVMMINQPIKILLWLHIDLFFCVCERDVYIEFLKFS